MFTGIIECEGEVVAIENEGSNINFTISSEISNDLKVDQSVSHDGICLTVVKLDDNKHVVTAIQETINKTNLSSWEIGSKVNIERAMLATGRFDGHIVQGHVDDTASCIERNKLNGSWEYIFQLKNTQHPLIVSKGSICINGVSLTVVNVDGNKFSIALIPYTFENTNFKFIEKNSIVNIEFDILGKYVDRAINSK